MPGNDSNQSVGRGAAVGLRGIYEGVALSVAVTAFAREERRGCAWMLYRVDVLLREGMR